MHFDLLVPCHDCPFLRKGGIRLTQARVEEIAGAMLSTQGSTFTCHKTTVDNDGELVEGPRSRHCAGALIFAEKNGNATQMMRIAERLHDYDARKLMSQKDVVESVFDDLDEMLAVNRRYCDGQQERKETKVRKAPQEGKSRAVSLGMSQVVARSPQSPSAPAGGTPGTDPKELK